MGKEADNKFTWVIKNFSSLNSEKIFSDQFVIGGCKWRIIAFPKGNSTAGSLSLYLEVADAEDLPSGWRRHVKFSFTVVNQIPGNVSQLEETQKWFDHKDSDWGFPSMIPLSELKAENDGFIVNGEVKIVADVEVLEVVGKLDVAERSEEATQSLKKIKMNDGGAVSIDLLKETPSDWVDVNGFQVLSSQEKLVSRIFKKCPDIALELRAKNKHLRTACMNVLLSVIETLCQSPQELSNEDLVEADNALSYVEDAGFKVDWLKEKLEEMKEKKEEEQNGETQMRELEEELKIFKQKCSDIEALLKRVKAMIRTAQQQNMKPISPKARLIQHLNTEHDKTNSVLLPPHDGSYAVKKSNGSLIMTLIESIQNRLRVPMSH